MIIDFRTHIFPEKIAARTIKYLEDEGGARAHTDATHNGLLEEMKKSQVE